MEGKELKEECVRVRKEYEAAICKKFGFPDGRFIDWEQFLEALMKSSDEKILKYILFLQDKIAELK